MAAITELIAVLPSRDANPPTFSRGGRRRRHATDVAGHGVREVVPSDPGRATGGTDHVQ
jgi:hypothetical protein